MRIIFIKLKKSIYPKLRIMTFNSTNDRGVYL